MAQQKTELARGAWQTHKILVRIRLKEQHLYLTMWPTCDTRNCGMFQKIIHDCDALFELLVLFHWKCVLLPLPPPPLLLLLFSLLLLLTTTTLIIDDDAVVSKLVHFDSFTVALVGLRNSTVILFLLRVFFFFFFFFLLRGEKKRDREADRQTGRQTGRNKQTGRQAGRQTDRQTETDRQWRREGGEGERGGGGK